MILDTFIVFIDKRMHKMLECNKICFINLKLALSYNKHTL